MPQLCFTDLSSFSRTAKRDGLPLALTAEEQAGAAALGLVDGMPFILGDDGSYDHHLNRFFRACPTLGVRSINSLRAYARDILVWMRFLQERCSGKSVWTANREDMAAFHEARRLSDPPFRVSAATWNRAVGSLDKLYLWALDEKIITSVPFAYRQSWAYPSNHAQNPPSATNCAREKGARKGDTRFLDLEGFKAFRDVGLRGRLPDGREDPTWRGRNGERNARFLRMGPSLIRRSVQRLLLGLRRFWTFLTDQGDVPIRLADITVAMIDDYETWLERRGGGRIQQRQLLAAVIGVLRAGAEDHPGLLRPELLPRLRFLGHGSVGSSIPRDAYDGRIAEAFRGAARRQIFDAQGRIALGDKLPPHPTAVAACPRLTAHHDDVLAEIAACGQIGTRHPAFKRFANLGGRRKLDIGIDGPHRGFHLATSDLAAFLILLSLETGMETESLIRLKADCLRNATKGYVEIAYHKRRARGAEWKRLRVRDGSTATPGGLIRLALALTERARRHLGSDRLWVLWTIAGLRPASEDGRQGIDAFMKTHGLKDDGGKPLHVNLSRLRKTQKAEWYRRTGGQMEQFAVGHSVAVAARHYAEIPALAHIHEEALAAAFQDALDAARIVPPPLDATQEVLPADAISEPVFASEPQELWLARCGNFFASPFGAEGKPCPTPFWGCLECKNAVISEAKLPALIAFQAFMADQRAALHADDWAVKFAKPFGRITHQILPAFPPQVVEAARILADVDGPALFYLPVEATAL